jgi:hypothetical protein
VADGFTRRAAEKRPVPEAKRTLHRSRGPSGSGRRTGGPRSITCHYANRSLDRSAEISPASRSPAPRLGDGTGQHRISTLPRRCDSQINSRHKRPLLARLFICRIASKIPCFKLRPPTHADQGREGTIMGVHVSVARRSGEERKAAHLAKMLEVGAIITRNQPSWLPDVLSNFSSDVYSAHNTEAMWPTRTQMWDSLADAGGAAIELSRVVDDWAMVAFLTSNSPTDYEAVSQLKDLLSKLAASAHQARKAPQLIGADGNILPGRGKPFLPGQMPGKFLCAAVIAEVWAFFNEKDPAPSNRRAWNAADEFWHSWVPPESWGTDPLTRWKRYSENVRDPKLELFRSEIQRWLKTSAHLAAVMLEK